RLAKERLKGALGSVRPWPRIVELFAEPLEIGGVLNDAIDPVVLLDEVVAQDGIGRPEIGDVRADDVEAAHNEAFVDLGAIIHGDAGKRIHHVRAKGKRLAADHRQLLRGLLRHEGKVFSKTFASSRGPGTLNASSIPCSRLRTSTSNAFRAVSTSAFASLI